MSRLWQFLTHRRVLATFGLLALAAFLFLGADTLEIAALWAVLAGLVLLAGWGVWWLLRARRHRRAAAALSEAIAPSSPDSDQAQAVRNDAAVLRKGMLEAINTIKTSKLGLTWGGRWTMMDFGHTELRLRGVMRR